MIFPATLRTLLAKLHRTGIKLSGRHLFLCLAVPPSAIQSCTLDLLSRFMAQAGLHCRAVIRGVPACLLPAHETYLVYPVSADPCNQPALRIPACRSCARNAQCPGWPAGTTMNPVSVRPVRDIPREIVFELTDRCNLSCQYCTGSSRGTTLLDESLIRQTLNEAARLGVPAIRFTGGEPLLYPKLADMLKLAKHKGFAITLNTNATLLPKRILPILSSTTDCVLISLKGHDPLSDRRLTGSTPALFRQKLNNILTLRTAIPVFYLGTVVSSSLLENFSAYVRLVRALRPAMWILFRPMPAKGSAGAVSEKDLAPLMKKVYTLNCSGLRTIFGNALPFCVLPDLQLTASVLSNALADDGNGRLIMDAGGRFRPSYFMRDDLGSSLRTAWSTAAALTQANNHKNKGGVPDYLPSACHVCDFFRMCRGGSRVCAESIHSTRSAPDPLFKPRSSQKLRIPARTCQ